MTRCAAYGDAARMPPSSVLSTRYRTSRRCPVIRRGHTTLCHDGVARCGASASAGAAEVKWCQFNGRVRAVYYAAAGTRRCGSPEILLVPVESRVTYPGTDQRSTCSRVSTASTCYAEDDVVVLCSGTSGDGGGGGGGDEPVVTAARGTVNSYREKFLPGSSYPELRGFSIPVAAERKQQNAVTRSRRPVEQLLAAQ